MGAFDDIINEHESRLLGRVEVDANGNVTRTPGGAYGDVGMKPQRTWKDTVMDAFLSLLGKGGDFSGTVNPSMFTGVVMNPRNAGLIRTALSKLLQANPNMTDQELAINFMREKYPKIAGLANKIEATALPFKPGRILGGQYVPSSRTVQLPASAQTYMPTDVETVGHELTHALQFTRDPISIRTTYLQPETLGHPAYEGQYWERAARQGGSTARKAFDAFRQMSLESEGVLDLGRPVTKEEVDAAIPDLMQRVSEMKSSGHMPAYIESTVNGINSFMDNAAATAEGKGGEWPVTIGALDTMTRTQANPQGSVAPMLQRSNYKAVTGGSPWAADMGLPKWSLRDILTGGPPIK